MFGRLGLPEFLVILAILLLVFGVGRISKIASELGSGIRAFRDGLKGDEQEDKTESKDMPNDKTQRQG